MNEVRHQDLLVRLLGGRGARDAVRVLARGYPRLRELAAAAPEELSRLPGVGRASALRVCAAFELARCWASERSGDRPRLTSSRAIFELVHLDLRDLDREVFETLALDAKNRLLRRDRVSTGTLTGSLVHPREVFRPALAAGAAALVVVHNHPSGDPAPSREDREVTRRLVLAGEILGIKLLDHVVVGDGRYHSFADGEALHAAAASFEETEA